MYIFIGLSLFILGMLSAMYSYKFLALSTLPFLYLKFYRKEKISKIIILFSFIILGIIIVLLFPKGDKSLTTLEGICLKRSENYALVYSLSGIYYINDKAKKIALFSIVQLSGSASELSFYHYESIFRFDNYLNSTGCFTNFTYSSCNTLFSLPFSLDNIDYYSKYLDENSVILVDSLLFGKSVSNLSELHSLKNLYLTSAITISGLHLSFLERLIEKILGKKYEKFFFPIELVINLTFLVFSSFRYSMKRICLLFFLKNIKIKSQKLFSQIEYVSLTAFILLLFEPYSLISMSFYYPFILLFTLSLFNTLNKENTIKNKLLFPLFIFLLFLPIQLASNHYLSLLSLLAQFILLPFSHVIFLLSLLLFICPIFGNVLNLVISCYLSFITLIDESSIIISCGEISLVLMILLYFSLLMFLIFKNYNFKKEASISLISFSLLTSYSFIPDYSEHYEVTFIDVDQGDCTLVRFENYNILIDTGGKKTVDLAENCLIPYFEKRKINKLDAVLITHEDYDHCGALDSLKENFTVDNIFYASDFLNTDGHYMDFSSLRITDLNNTQNDDEENMNSAVFSFQIKEMKFLIMGDAPKEIEEEILNENYDIDCDIIKIGHHGSKTSSSEEFLKACSPNVAIISVGLTNYYGHPHQETLNTLNKLNIQIRRTDLEGTITYNIS